MPTETLDFWHPDRGVLPGALPRAWPLSAGGSVVLQSDGAAVTAGAGGYFRRQLVDADPATGLERIDSIIEAEATLTVASWATSWGSGASPIGLWVSDGRREVFLSVGQTVRWVDPATGAIIAEVATGQPVTSPFEVLVRKWGQAYWIVEIDGQEAGRIAYGQAPSATVELNAVVAIGHVDVGGTGEFVLGHFAVGLNRALPGMWLVNRFRRTMHPSVQARWTHEATALLFALIAVARRSMVNMREFGHELTAARTVQDSATLDGDVDPAAASPAWTKVGAMSIVRERLRFNPGTVQAHTYYSFTAPAAPLEDRAVELVAELDAIVWSWTAGPNGRIGPYLWIEQGSRTIVAQLVEDDAGAGEAMGAWVLTDTVLTGGVVEVGRRWRVDPRQKHHVELRVFGDAKVLLVVDGEIVDRQDVGAFPGAAVAPRVRVGCQQGPTGPQQVYFDAWNIVAARNVHDTGRRSLLYQTAIERLIFRGGCERNDELETWKERRHGVHRLRGTTRGLLVELERLCCSTDVAVVDNASPAEWIVESTFPDVTPIYLESTGTVHEVTVEFVVGALLLTIEELGELICRYLTPVSVQEMRYRVALASRITGASSVPSPGTTRIDVVNTRGFEAGDEIEVRDSTGATIEFTTVQAINSSTQLDVDETTSTWAADDRIRLVMCST